VQPQQQQQQPQRPLYALLADLTHLTHLGLQELGMSISYGQLTQELKHLSALTGLVELSLAPGMPLGGSGAASAIALALKQACDEPPSTGTKSMGENQWHYNTRGYTDVFLSSFFSGFLLGGGRLSQAMGGSLRSCSTSQP
jgi:hypothetical protein